MRLIFAGNGRQKHDIATFFASKRFFWESALNMSCRKGKNICTKQKTRQTGGFKKIV